MESIKNIDETLDIYENSRVDFHNTANDLRERETSLLQERVKLLDLFKSCDNLVAPGDEPTLGKYVAGLLKESWVIVMGTLLCIHGVVYILKLMFDISWNTWNWIATTFCWMLPISGCLCAIGYLVYKSRETKWNKLSEEYEENEFHNIINELSSIDKSFNEQVKDYISIVNLRTSSVLSEDTNVLKSYIFKYSMLFYSDREDIQKEQNILKLYIQNFKDQMSYIDSIIPTSPKEKKSNEDDFVVTPCVGGLLFILFAFHCLIWLLKFMFDISWDTWHWVTVVFWIALPICAIEWIVMYYKTIIDQEKHSSDVRTYNIYKEASESLKNDINEAQEYLLSLKKNYTELENHEKNIIPELFNQHLALPIRSIDKWEINTALHTFLSLFHKKNEAYSAVNERVKKLLDFHDDKLLVFYEHSLESEYSGPYKDLKLFIKMSKQDNMRSEFTPKGIFTKDIDQLTCDVENFIDIDKIVNTFIKIQDIDDSGTFLEYDCKKVEDKTNQLLEYTNKFSKRVSSFQDITKRINKALNLVRLVAYRNIYLGVEIINIVRINGGGGMLTTATDNIDCLSGDFVQLDMIEEFSGNDALVEIFDSAIGSALCRLESMVKSKDGRKLISQNPKTALLAAGGAALIAGISTAMETWKQRNQKIEYCLESQKESISRMEELMDFYLAMQTSSLRAIEVIKAIIKVNKGFMTIYQPIKEKVFIKQAPETITIKELQELALAVADFKKISETKL